jgi:hypothetical protein
MVGLFNRSGVRNNPTHFLGKEIKMTKDWEQRKIIAELPNDNWLELTSELTDYVMTKELDNDYEDYIVEEDNVIRYTEEGQKIFNDTLDEVEYILNLMGIFMEDV